jgi:hypothetical protein
VPSCLACLKAGIECVRSLQVRFRNGLDNVDDVYSFPQSQTWVELENDRKSFLGLPSACYFYMRLTSYQSSTVMRRPNSRSCTKPYQMKRSSKSCYIGCSMATIISYHQTPSLTRISTAVASLQLRYDASNIKLQSDSDNLSPQEPFHSPPARIPTPSNGPQTPGISSPSILGGRPASQGSSMSYSTHQGLSPSSSPPVVPFTSQEAILMRNFVENMALWVRETIYVWSTDQLLRLDRPMLLT